MPPKLTNPTNPRYTARPCRFDRSLSVLGTSLSVLSKGGEDGGGGGKEGSSFYGRSLNDALNRDREENLRFSIDHDFESNVFTRNYYLVLFIY